ncbi:armadillo repeat-containing protein 7-like [Salmo salar]|uniref:Armadillo repeat-containing protein 7-like n=1 Tax=Salmo salar TaxID=8030 RepID=A0A1S3Q355_SALSA|nr:armadillo repeat-containing protein 7-like [Salmo salar]|eukprot:XP_014034390.1 PREDICTED: armadillo repeat-containing protein 7-like [Salmo salar]
MQVGHVVNRMCKYWCNYKKEQVLANFANFASNPRNLEDLRTLQVTELFLDMLTEENENVLFFSISHSPRLRNLASVFLQDCCTKDQVARAEALMQGHNPTALGSPFLRTRLVWRHDC